MDILTTNISPKCQFGLKLFLSMTNCQGAFGYLRKVYTMIWPKNLQQSCAEFSYTENHRGFTEVH
jgi:hypothetical protein